MRDGLNRQALSATLSKKSFSTVADRDFDFRLTQ
jgi:hypothetical protein